MFLIPVGSGFTSSVEARGIVGFLGGMGTGWGCERHIRIGVRGFHLHFLETSDTEHLAFGLT